MINDLTTYRPLYFVFELDGLFLSHAPMNYYSYTSLLLTLEEIWDDIISHNLNLNWTVSSNPTYCQHKYLYIWELFRENPFTCSHLVRLYNVLILLDHTLYIQFRMRKQGKSYIFHLEQEAFLTGGGSFRIWINNNRYSGENRKHYIPIIILKI